MKQSILLNLLTILSISFGYSQKENKHDDKSKLEKRTVKVELIDVSGQINKGFLWYADSTVIGIVKNVVNPDTVFMYAPEYIYTMKLTTSPSYGKRPGNAMLISSAAGLAFTGLSYASGEAIMIEPIFFLP